MPERIGEIPGWAWIAGAVLVVLGIFMGHRLVEAQQQLADTQIELKNVKTGAEKAKAEREELQVKLEQDHIGPQINGIPARRDSISTRRRPERPGEHEAAIRSDKNPDR